MWRITKNNDKIALGHFLKRCHKLDTQCLVGKVENDVKEIKKRDTEKERTHKWL